MVDIFITTTSKLVFVAAFTITIPGRTQREFHDFPVTMNMRRRFYVVVAVNTPLVKNAKSKLTLVIYQPRAGPNIFVFIRCIYSSLYPQRDLQPSHTRALW